VGSNVEGDAAERFASAWDAFVLAIRRTQARGQQSSDELTLGHYYLLAPLTRERAVPICRLAESAGIAAPTATRIVDGLERANILTRERSPEDRREVLVTLTPTGRDRFKRRQRQLARRRRALYDRLAPDEREQSERLLRHLAELIAEL